MIKSVIVNVKETFAGNVVFLGCDQKTERIDRKDPRSGMQIVQGKWSVELMVKPLSKNGEKAKHENITVTMDSKANPCENLHEYQPVDLDHLEYNVMVNERTGNVQPWFNLGGIRPVGAVANQPSQAAR